MRLINFQLFSPGNVVAIGAIIFFWGALAFFVREHVADEIPSKDQ